MNLSSWENNLRATASEIELLTQRIQQLVNADDPSAFERVNRAADDAQLQAMLDTVRAAAGGSHGQPPRIAALRHWIGNATNMLQNYYWAQTLVLTKMMWLKLIQTRLTGNRSTNIGTSSQEVLEMAIRRNNLRKSRDFLRTQLDRLKREKLELHKRYQALDIQRSNYSAAQSMKIKLGSPRRDLSQNSLLRSLDGFFTRLTLPVRLKSKKFQHAANVVKAVESRSAELMDQFRQVAENSQPSHTPASANPDLNLALKSGQSEIKTLDHMLSTAETELSNPNPPTRAKLRLKKTDNIRSFRL